jgi:hypothetical protein
MRSVRILLALSLWFSTACRENTPCAFPSDQTDTVVCTLGEPVALARLEIGGSESAIGDAVVDAYQHALIGSLLAPVGAIDTAGDVHSGGLCLPEGEESNLPLPAGPLTWQRLRDVLPTTDPLVVENVSLQTHFNTLEHGVAGPPGAIDSSTGRFVETAGISYVVDCAQPAETLTRVGGTLARTAEGARVRSLTLQGQTFLRSDETADTVLVPIALPQSLAQGGDAFVDLEGAWVSQSAAAWSPTNTVAFDAVAQFLQARQAMNGTVTLQADRRITLMNCAGN